MAVNQTQNLLEQALQAHRGGRLDRAAALYAQVIKIAPGHFDAVHLAGTLALQQHRIPEALELLTRAYQLNPRSAVCALGLGVARLIVGRRPEAEAVLRQAVKLDPRLVEAWDNLAYALKAQDKLEEAVQCHQRAVTLNPRYAVGWFNYGLTLSLMGRPSEALTCHDRALAADPGFAKGHYGRAQVLQQTNRIAGAIAEYDRYIQAEPNEVEAWSYRLFALNYLPGISRERLFAEHVAYGRKVGGRATVPLPNPRDPARPLRLAVLSSDLRLHSCAYFLEPLLRHLDRGSFELYLYHDHLRVDAVSDRLRALAKVWRNFVGQGEQTVEQAIRADQPDILIDISGHTGMTIRLPLFAKRLAPVQITYLGYPNTTGLAEMDYRLTDSQADPAGDADRFATEKLVRLDPTAWTYQPLPVTPPVGPVPSLATGAVTFGCFNNLSKLTDETIAVWARLLVAVPGSRLLLKGRGLADDPTLRRIYQDRLAAGGIPLESVELLDRTPDTADHLAVYGRVDVALDTFPYHGTTTTCEAMWMGVPVVTQEGDRHCARVGVSLLRAVGHPEWIAADAEDYVRRAAALARDPARLQGIRANLRAEMAASPLMDQAGQAARFGAALRQCWREYCAKPGPAAPA